MVLSGREKSMYQTGDRVVYGMHGVCLVADREVRIVDRKEIAYLILEPVGQKGSRYMIPEEKAASMSKLRYLMDQPALSALLQSEDIKADVWIPEERNRKQYYKELVSSCVPLPLIRMLRCVYRYRAEQAAAGKKFHMCDENFMRDCERMLSGEISVIQGISQAEALQYLRERLKEDA